jgi:hypothetical protein
MKLFVGSDWCVSPDTQSALKSLKGGFTLRGVIDKNLADMVGAEVGLVLIGLNRVVLEGVITEVGSPSLSGVIGFQFVSDGMFYPGIRESVSGKECFAFIEGFTKNPLTEEIEKSVRNILRSMKGKVWDQ